MKKNKLLIIMLLFIFFLSGCTTNYNLTIANDLYVKDEAISNIDDDFFENLTLSRDSFIRNIIRGNIEKINELNYTYSVEENGSKVIFHGYSRSIDNYINNNEEVYQQWFKTINKEQNGTLMTISAKDFYPYNEQDPNKVIIKNLHINIKIPFSVTNHNADKVNKNDNIYTWKINKDTKDKSIVVTFDTSKPRYDKKNILNGISPSLLIIGMVILLVIVIFVIKMILIKRNVNQV